MARSRGTDDGSPSVVVVGPLPPPIHGAARVTAHMVEQLRQAGAQVVAVDTSGAADAGPLRYHLARIRSHAAAARVAWRERHRAASYYIAGAGGLGLWYQAVLVLIARAVGHRVVFHHHSYTYLVQANVAVRLMVRSGGRRMEHVALCNGMARTLKDRYPAVRSVHVCSNAWLYDPLDSPAPRPGAEDGIVLGHLGNLSEEKGLSDVFATLRRLRSDGVPVRLLLGGPVGDADAGQQLEAARAEFGEAVEHLGPIRPDDVEAFYRRVDVFVFPSRNEAEPLVVLEASRCGVPTVAFSIGCMPSLVPDADWLVNLAGDFPEAAARVVRRLRDAEDREACRQSVLGHFAHRHQVAGAAQRRLRDDLQTPRAPAAAAC
ncbi:MAG: glycosyltransferase family 4 protein [Jatrophihabitans sp.]|uniref:glycosyltransferase family 4 protein n=1 Tax=Jatrophihabitans sp. TaxID=1932789 RepID=UPI0039136970